jgi:CubicO group peptidase (beta-lactamase class C family)
VLELLDLVARGDAGVFEAYVGSAFARAPDGPPGDVLNVLAGLHDRTRGVDGVTIECTGAEATAQGLSKLTGEPVALRVRVEPRPPYRVTSFQPVRAAERVVAVAARPSDDRLAAEVGAYTQRLADADCFSGVVLLAREGRPLLLNAYGEASREYRVPNAVDTRFNLGSITKSFTAVAVLQLAERGKLSLDDPVARFVPDVPDAESAKRITIRQLLTHTSGLGDHVNAMARDPFRTRYRTVGRMLDLVRGVPPMFEPGSRWRYSNSGYLALGAVVEAAGGRDYYDYVRENVFAPAGMRDTDFFDLDQVRCGLASGYEKEFVGGRRRLRNNHFDLFVRGGPEGGAYSTAGDLLRFARALKSGTLLRPETAREAMSAKPALGSDGYGYGFEVEEGGRVVGHGGSFVGAQTKLDCFADGDYTAVVLSNLSGAARPVVWKIRGLLLADAPGAGGAGSANSGAK